MLTLPIKRKWYDMILSGEKKEEYREITQYWRSRFYNAGLINQYGWKWLPQQVLFRNGYGKDRPSFVAMVSVEDKEGRPEWGAEPGKTYWVLKILKIESEQSEGRAADGIQSIGGTDCGAAAGCRGLCGGANQEHGGADKDEGF